MSDLEPKEPGEHCNARKSDGSGHCGHTAGWGTDHTGHGRCKYHGGSTPNQEKAIMEELSETAENVSVAYRLFTKHVKQKAEAGEFEDVDWAILDRIGRTSFDRSGNGPSEKREVTGEGGGGIVINLDDGDS